MSDGHSVPHLLQDGAPGSGVWSPSVRMAYVERAKGLRFTPEEVYDKASVCEDCTTLEEVLDQAAAWLLHG